MFKPSALQCEREREIVKLTKQMKMPMTLMMNCCAVGVCC